MPLYTRVCEKREREAGRRTPAPLASVDASDLSFWDPSFWAELFLSIEADDGVPGRSSLGLGLVKADFMKSSSSWSSTSR
jgi:hypothetical protein